MLVRIDLHLPVIFIKAVFDIIGITSLSSPDMVGELVLAIKDSKSNEAYERALSHFFEDFLVPSVYHEITARYGHSGYTQMLDYLSESVSLCASGIFDTIRSYNISGKVTYQTGYENGYLVFDVLNESKEVNHASDYRLKR